MSQATILASAGILNDEPNELPK